MKSGIGKRQRRNRRNREQQSQARAKLGPPRDASSRLGIGADQANELRQVLGQGRERAPSARSGALAVTRDGRTSFKPRAIPSTLLARVHAHEAVHRRQFSNLGRAPIGTVAQLEEEAHAGSEAILQGDSFTPQYAAPPGETLAFEIPHQIPAGRAFVGAFSTADFIQDNKEFYRDLLFATKHRGRRPKLRGVAGQTPQCLTSETMAHLFATRPDELRACLSSELDRWKENAERIVLTNQTALFLGFVEATTDALFGELPGPSLTTQLVTDLVIDVAAAVLEQVYAPGLLGNLAASLAGLAADAWFHAEAKEDLDETRAVFKQHLMSQIEIVRERILRDLSRLNPLYAFRLEWLAGADASELTDFTIPFTPRDTSQAQWTGSFRNGYIRVSEKHRAR